MTPHHQVNEVVQKLLWNVVSGSMLTPEEKKYQMYLNYIHKTE